MLWCLISAVLNLTWWNFAPVWIKLGTISWDKHHPNVMVLKFCCTVLLPYLRWKFSPVWIKNRHHILGQSIKMGGAWQINIKLFKRLWNKILCLYITGYFFIWYGWSRNMIIYYVYNKCVRHKATFWICLVKLTVLRLQYRRTDSTEIMAALTALRL